MTVLSIINELRKSNSGNHKMEVLRREKDNDELRRFFIACLDDSINYYIRQVPKYAKPHTMELDLAGAIEELNKLARREKTGNAAKVHVSKILTMCSEDDAEAVKMIIARDADCKVSVSTVNKVWPGLVPAWPCMLCERSTRKNLDGLQYPAIAQEKSDGLRMNVLHVGGKTWAVARSGKFIQLHGALDGEVAEIAKHVPYDNFVLDGEGLIVKKSHFRTPSSKWNEFEDFELFEDRSTGNGIFNKAIKNTIEEREASLVRMKLWDVIPYHEFLEGKGRVPYKTRITIVKRVLEAASLTVNRIGMSLTKLVNDERQALLFYREMLGRRKEGAILKELESLWEDARPKSQVKLKVVKQVDLRCVGTYPHKKKPNWIGGLNLESEDGVVKVNSGSGLKDADRKKPADHYVGKVVMIESNGLIDSKDNPDGEYSLYLPIYKETRLDKDHADTYTDIVEIFDSI